MAFTNTITAKAFQYDKENSITPGWELLQTYGSALATSGAIKIFAAATASDDFRLMSLLVSPTNPTATSYLTVYAGTDAICVLPTASTSPVMLNFAPYGLACGTTTTNTVSLFITTATQTVSFIAQGLRKV